jgi:hypothetical protein
MEHWLTICKALSSTPQHSKEEKEKKKLLIIPYQDIGKVYLLLLVFHGHSSSVCHFGHQVHKGRTSSSDLEEYQLLGIYSFPSFHPEVPIPKLFF